MQLRLPLLLILFALTACEQLGLDDQAKIAAAREADGRALGNACRQTGRVLEECYALNPKYQKAAIFAGWREMDGYMRENKIENAEKPGSDAKSGEAKSAEAKPTTEKPKEANGVVKPAAKR